MLEPAPQDVVDRPLVPRTFTCDFCGEEWRNPISAAMCCDMAAPNTLHDDRRPERYYLSED